MKLKPFNGLLFAATLISPTVFAASFDCAKAHTWVEKTICSTAELSKLDEEVAKIYKNEQSLSQQKGVDKAELQFLKARQLSWLKIRRNTCTTTACLKHEYLEKLGRDAPYFADTDNMKPPASYTFGHFDYEHEIFIYEPTAPEGYSIEKANNTLSIHAIPSKPYLSIIDLETVTTNAHLCFMEDKKFAWADNHWVYFEQAHYDANDRVDCELRIYPVKTKSGSEMHFFDIDNACRRIMCGARGGLDGELFSK